MRRTALFVVAGFLLVPSLPGTGQATRQIHDSQQRSSGEAWERVESGTSLNLKAVTIGATGAAVGANGVLLVSDGTTWSLVPTPTTMALNAVFAAAAFDLWAVGNNGTVLRYDADGVAKVASGTTRNLNAVWGLGGGEVFAAGDFGTILRFHDGAWHKMDSGTTLRLAGVGGRSPSDLFAVGLEGTILHFDGDGWERVESGTTRNLNAIWAEQSDEIYVVGDAGTILRYDGKLWTHVPSPTTRNLNGVWATGGDVYVVGDYGTILEQHGGTFGTMESGTAMRLNGVHGRFAVGNYGTVLVNPNPAAEPFTPVFFQSVDARAVPGGVTLRWDVFADEPFGGFRVYRRASGAPELPITATLPAGARSFDDRDVLSGRTYTYTVAVVAAGGEELRAQPVTATVPKAQMTLRPGAPNPFAASAAVEYSLAAPGRIRLRVYDVRGRLVATLADGHESEGTHAAVWNGLRANGEPAAAGTYFVRLEAEQNVLTTKIVLVR